jgi:hypothetical protein
MSMMLSRKRDRPLFSRCGWPAFLTRSEGNLGFDSGEAQEDGQHRSGRANLQEVIS